MQSTFERQMKTMSVESQIYMAENINSFTEKLTNFLTKFDGDDKVLTVDHVREFFIELNEERERTLREHLSISR